MNPKRKKKHKKGAAQWMVTYSDMVTLILVFFILLFSISQIDAEKFRAVAESYQNRAVFDFMPSAIPLDNPSNTDDEALDPEKEELPGFMDTDEDAEDGQDLDELAQAEEDTLDALHEEVETFLEEEQLNDVITASRTDRGIVLVLQER